MPRQPTIASKPSSPDESVPQSSSITRQRLVELSAQLCSDRRSNIGLNQRWPSRRRFASSDTRGRRTVHSYLVRPVRRLVEMAPPLLAQPGEQVEESLDAGGVGVSDWERGGKVEPDQSSYVAAPWVRVGTGRDQSQCTWRGHHRLRGVYAVGVPSRVARTSHRFFAPTLQSAWETMCGRGKRLMRGQSAASKGTQASGSRGKPHRDQHPEPVERPVRAFGRVDLRGELPEYCR
jgi:hypothetical protein